jgi:hypothetical protein
MSPLLTHTLPTIRDKAVFSPLGSAVQCSARAQRCSEHEDRSVQGAGERCANCYVYTAVACICTGRTCTSRMRRLAQSMAMRYTSTVRKHARPGGALAHRQDRRE